MDRRELIAAMVAAASAPALGRAAAILPPGLEEMVEIQFRITPEMQRMVYELAQEWGVTEDEVIAQCLQEAILIKQMDKRIRGKA
jgi:hypothetical protein